MMWHDIFYTIKFTYVSFSTRNKLQDQYIDILRHWRRKTAQIDDVERILRQNNPQVCKISSMGRILCQNNLQARKISSAERILRQNNLQVRRSSSDYSY